MVDPVVQNAEGVQGAASPEGAASKEGNQTVAPQQQALTEERVQLLIAEAVKRASENAREEGRREMQGKKDREVAEANRKVRLAEGRVKGYETGFQSLDEDTRQVLENSRLRSENQQFQTLAQEEETKRAQEAYLEQLKKALSTNLEALGIDTKDKRVDWAEDAPDYLTGRSLFDASVAKILKEDEGKRQGAFEAKQKTSFAEMERKLRVELGLETHDSSSNAAVAADSDAAFLKGMGDGSLPLTKANEERLNKIQNSY